MSSSRAAASRRRTQIIPVLDPAAMARHLARPHNLRALPFFLNILKDLSE